MRAPVPSRRAVVGLSWVLGVVIVLFLAWLYARVVTLSEQVNEADAQRDARASELEAIVEDVAAQKAALDEVNRRCVVAEDCTPVATPEIDDIEVQDGEVQEPEIQEPEVQEPERQDPEVDDAPVPGPAGGDGDDGTQGPQGPQGEQGPKGDTGATGERGPAGTAQPGTYVCPEGEYQRGQTIGPDGTVTLVCAPIPIVPGNAGGNP